MRKIILLGYMGSGKTTVAELFAKKAGIKCLDLDRVIEQKEHASITAIFETKGELYFRKLEHQAFADLMASDEEMVLALGGGTPCYANNHEWLQAENVTSVYLKASIDTLYGRLASDADNRPLVAGKSPEEIREFIAKHLFDRSYYYNQAHHKIAVDAKTPEAIVAEIAQLLA